MNTKQCKEITSFSAKRHTKFNALIYFVVGTTSCLVFFFFSNNGFEALKTYHAAYRNEPYSTCTRFISCCKLVSMIPSFLFFLSRNWIGLGKILYIFTHTIWRQYSFIFPHMYVLVPGSNRSIHSVQRGGLCHWVKLIVPAQTFCLFLTHIY